MNSDGHLTQEEVVAVAAAHGRPVVPNLAPAARLAISDHVAGCPDCRARLRAAAPGGAANVLAGLLEEQRRAAADPPERGEWLASIVPDPATADPASRELLEARLGLHPQIRAERDDLRAFQAGLEEFPPEHFSSGGTMPLTTGSPAARPAGSRERIGWPARWWLWLPLGGVAAAVTLLAAFGWRPAAWRSTGTVAQLNDGPVQVSANGEVRSALELPAGLRDAILETVRRRALPGAGLDGAWRGGEPAAASPPRSSAPSGGFAALSPVGTVVESTRPTLRWRPHPEAQRYELGLTLSGDESALPRRATIPAGATDWTPVEPLLRGRFYRWQVIAFGSDGRALTQSPASPGAVFKVLSSPAHEALERLRHDFAGSHLVLGVACAREGLRDEAAAEFRALQAAHPDSALARELATGASVP